MKKLWHQVKAAWSYIAAGDRPQLSGPPSLHVLFMAAMTLIWSLLAIAFWRILTENIGNPATGEENLGRIWTPYATELLTRLNLLPFLLAAGFCSSLALHCAVAALGLGYYANKKTKEKDELCPR